MMLLVVVFIATAIAGLAAISSGRVVSEMRMQETLEAETIAIKSAYSQIHMALNVVNTSGYDNSNHNLVLRDAIAGANGGTVAEAVETVEESVAAVRETVKGAAKKVAEGATNAVTEGTGDRSGYLVNDKLKDSVNLAWLDDETDPVYGFVRGTNVRVYRGREYIKRLARLKGDVLGNVVDPFGNSDAYFIIEAAGRSGDTIRLVSALVRENEPFSSFVFFQNRATLGVSGAPRGLIHTNETLAFYFPNGNYADSVSAVEGFEFLAGANTSNTKLTDANPEAARLDMESVDFSELKNKSDIYAGEDGLDAEIKLYSNGKVRIRPHTPPRIDLVEKSRTYNKFMGWDRVDVVVEKNVKVGREKQPYMKQVLDYYKDENYTVREQVQTGTRTVQYTDRVVDHYETEHYTKRQKVKVGTKQVTKYKSVTKQTGTKTVTKSEQTPIYSTRTVTKYKNVKVWKPFNTEGAGGGTTVGGGVGGAGAGPGEWVWESQPYEADEQYISGYDTRTWTEEEPVYTTTQEPYTVTENVYEWQDVPKTRQVAVYKNVTLEREEPVMEWQDVEKTRKVPVYKEVEKFRWVDIYELQEVTVKKWERQYEEVTETWTEEVYTKPQYMSYVWNKLGQGVSGTAYVDGRVTKLAGKLNGRLTIVGNEKIRITGNLQYVDSKGNKAMENGESYTEAFERNPDYTGSSVLGLIARNDIVYTHTMPSNAEINATLMSVEGRVGIDAFWADETGEVHKDSTSARNKYLTPEQILKEKAYDKIGNYRTRKFKKNSLRRIGGAISNDRIMETFIKTDGNGYAYVDAGFKRGNMKFDINLLFNPPPNFVEVSRPVVTSFLPITMVRERDA